MVELRRSPEATAKRSHPGVHHLHSFSVKREPDPGTQSQLIRKLFRQRQREASFKPETPILFAVPLLARAIARARRGTAKRMGVSGLKDASLCRCRNNFRINWLCVPGSGSRLTEKLCKWCTPG